MISEVRLLPAPGPIALARDTTAHSSNDLAQAFHGQELELEPDRLRMGSRVLGSCTVGSEGLALKEVPTYGLLSSSNVVSKDSCLSSTGRDTVKSGEDSRAAGCQARDLNTAGESLRYSHKTWIS